MCECIANERAGAINFRNNVTNQGLLAGTSIEVLKTQMEREIEVVMASHA